MHVVDGGSNPRAEEVVLPLERIDWAIHSGTENTKGKQELTRNKTTLKKQKDIAKLLYSALL